MKNIERVIDLYHLSIGKCLRIYAFFLFPFYKLVPSPYNYFVFTLPLLITAVSLLRLEIEKEKIQKKYPQYHFKLSFDRDKILSIND